MARQCSVSAGTGALSPNTGPGGSSLPRHAVCGLSPPHRLPCGTEQRPSPLRYLPKPPAHRPCTPGSTSSTRSRPPPGRSIDSWRQPPTCPQNRHEPAVPSPPGHQRGSAPHWATQGRRRAAESQPSHVHGAVHGAHTPCGVQGHHPHTLPPVPTAEERSPHRLGRWGLHVPLSGSAGASCVCARGKTAARPGRPHGFGVPAPPSPAYWTSHPSHCPVLDWSGTAPGPGELAEDIYPRGQGPLEPGVQRRAIEGPKTPRCTGESADVRSSPQVPHSVPQRPARRRGPAVFRRCSRSPWPSGRLGPPPRGNPEGRTFPRYHSPGSPRSMGGPQRIPGHAGRLRGGRSGRAAGCRGEPMFLSVFGGGRSAGWFPSCRRSLIFPPPH